MKRNKYVFVTITLLCVLTLCGCASSEEKRSQTYEYTHLNTLMTHICEEEMAIGDWGYGSENNGAISKKINPESSIFDIHVNPLANDELLDLYVRDLMVMDGHLAQNKEYLKYAKKNHPYYVGFDCMGEEILTVPLDGQVDEQSVRKELAEVVAPKRIEAEKRVEEFDIFIRSYKDIQVSDSGEYYYVLDSKNVSESIESIMKSIEEIAAAYPFSEEELSGLNGSFKYVERPGNGYRIFCDSYGNDPLARDYTFLFSEYPYVIYNCAYSHFVPVGTIEETPARMYYYCTCGPEENESYGGYEAKSPLTQDDINEIMWKIYDRVVTEHEEHGIKAIANLELIGNCTTKDDPEVGYETKLVIPMSKVDERIPKEEFIKMVEEATDTFNFADRILHDDCF